MQQTIGDMLQAADDADDFDRLFMQAACINLVNSAVGKLGHRVHWTVDDAKRLAAVMHIVSDVQPVQRDYAPKGRVEPQRAAPVIDPALRHVPLRPNTDDAISRLHATANDANREEAIRHANVRSR